jgi:small subunit ribosomal protein S16
MLAIKLKLIGKKGQHSFRMIVQEKRAKLQGEAVDDLGWFNPHSNQIKLDQEKLKHWIDNGAQPTESAQKIIAKAGDDSEVRSFEGRKSSKKRKKDKKAAVSPGTPVGTEESQPTETSEETPKTEAEVTEDGFQEAVGAILKEEKEEKKVE